MSKIKLLVEVDEGAVYAIKTNQYYGSKSDLENLIANGTPITEGDLISRSALKEQFADIRQDFPKFHQFSFVSTEEIARKIDNAPTVAERPKGEWIFRSGVTCSGYYKCNKCGEVERAEKNFCSNCGADMRGDEK